MAIRYLVRRNSPYALDDMRHKFPNLEEQLGMPNESLRKSLKYSFSPVRYALYTFLPRKSGTTWSWVCPSIELVAEDEKGLFALTEQLGVPEPSHLSHLPA